MNQAQKEAYLRDYSVLKNEGKPFFPYAVAKDSVMALIVILVIVFLSLLFGAELGPKANPTTTSPALKVFFSCAVKLEGGLSSTVFGEPVFAPEKVR